MARRVEGWRKYVLHADPITLHTARKQTHTDTVCNGANVDANRLAAVAVASFCPVKWIYAGVPREDSSAHTPYRSPLVGHIGHKGHIIPLARAFVGA